jgi:methylase of polypeptide subunit release factors
VSDDAALVELLHFLRSHSYRFTAVTPATHARVLARPAPQPADLRDIFGWSRPFERQDLEPAQLTLLERAGAVESIEDGRLRSRVRVASLGDDLFVHSAFPTDDVDAVFFGPDTYRFVRFVEQHLPMSGSPRRIVDMGAGTGAGGIAMARRFRDARITLVDVNRQALRYAQVNASAAELEMEYLQSDRVPDEFDLLIGNAPYLMDASGRAYRDGGELLGGAVSLDWIRQGLERLSSGGMMLLYTAGAYVDGQAPMLSAIRKECREAGASLTIEEIDPDVFGEELGEPRYDAVERIAAVGIKIARTLQ